MPNLDDYHAYRSTTDDVGRGGSSGFGSFITSIIIVLVILSIIGTFAN